MVENYIFYKTKYLCLFASGYNIIIKIHKLFLNINLLELHHCRMQLNADMILC